MNNYALDNQVDARRSTGVGDVYAQPLPQGTALRLSTTSGIVSGLAWASNRELVFSQSNSLWRIAADGNREPEPVPGVGDGATYPAITHPASGPARMAYTRAVDDTNIWRMEIAPAGDDKVRTVTEPAAVIASTLADRSPQFSPDGKRIVFASNRDGYMEIWVSGSDGSNPSQLTTLKSARCGSPHWSPDGRQIVFDSLDAGNGDLWMVGAEGGPPKRLTTEPSNEARPSWSHDGRWIYFRSDRSGSQQIWKIPSSEPFQPAVQVTRNGGFEALESWDGKLLYYVKSVPGLWSLPLSGGEETLVIPSVHSSLWAVAENGVFFLEGQSAAAGKGTPIWWFRFETGRPIQVGAIHQPLVVLAPSFSVTRDGRWIAWSQIDHQQSNLMLVDNFR
jgi:WD40 repeat protein